MQHVFGSFAEMETMKTIVVPVDYSAASNNALEYALELARETVSSILLFHAYQVPVSITDVPIALVSIDELRQNAEARMLELKKWAQPQIEGKFELYTETSLGDTIDELGLLCDKIKPFLVVMGTHGAGIERTLFGSTAIAAVRRLTWPVVIVPPEKKFTPIRKIGFACDFRQVAETIPAHLISSFVKEFHSELHVLNVTASGGTAGRAEQSALLDTMLTGMNPVYDFIDDSDVDAGIEDFAQAHQLDLLIVIPKKHKLFAGIFRKSHSKELIFHARVPVMCIHE
jgi:nucleotide-binding universal stress UspA family protein